MKRQELGHCDPVLLERAIHAFAQLDAMAARGLECVFKGDTSLFEPLGWFRSRKQGCLQFSQSGDYENYGIRRLSELPLCVRLVRELHEKLMTGVRGGQATPSPSAG